MAGAYADIGGAVYVSESNLTAVPQYDLIDTLFHEMRHNYQNRAVARRLSSKEDVPSSELIEKWRINTLVYPSGHVNYISVGTDYDYLYNYQPVEVDAFKTGLKLARKSYFILREKFGIDGKFTEYANMQKPLIMNYFSQEEELVNNRKILDEEVEEYFNSNHEIGEFDEECRKHALDLWNKGLDNLSLDEVYALFSPFVWDRWSIDEKYEILMEYDKRVNPYKPTQIEKLGNTGFKIFDIQCNSDNAEGVLNLLFSEQFKTVVKHVVKGKAICDKKMIEELCINMYKAGGEKINYVGERDNYFKYVIQPYGVYEGKHIFRKYQDCKAAQLKHYGRSNGEYDHMMDMYDYPKMAKWLEDFFGKSFNEIYQENLHWMRNNIIEYELKRPENEILEKVDEVRKSGRMSSKK